MSRPNPVSQVIGFVKRNPMIYEGIKLATAGVFIELGRRISVHIADALTDGFTLTATLGDTDPAYAWVLNWIQHSCFSEKQNQVSLWEDVLESLYPTGRVPPKEMVLRTNKPLYAPNSEEDENDDGTDRRMGGPFELYKLPHLQPGITLSFQGHSLHFVGRKGESHVYINISVVTFDRDRDIFDSLIFAARALYLSQNQDRLSIYIPRASRWCDEGNWQLASLKPVRPWKSLFLPSKIKEAVLNDAEEFLSNSDFYKVRGLPYRRGYLLYGLPGTGKTSLITAIASHFNLGVYIVNLGSPHLDDDFLQKIVMDCPKKCVLLLEDITRKKKTDDMREKDRQGEQDKKDDMKTRETNNEEANDKMDGTDTEVEEGKDSKGENQGQIGEGLDRSEEAKNTAEAGDIDITEQRSKASQKGEDDTVDNSHSPQIGAAADPQPLDRSTSKTDDNSKKEKSNDDKNNENSDAEEDSPIPFSQPRQLPRSVPIGPEKQKKEEDEEEDLPESAVTLSGLLNAIDGLAASEGRLLFCTTNHIKMIDPVLSRPGRCDVWVEFTYATPEQARDLFFFFYTASSPIQSTPSELDVECQTQIPISSSCSSAVHSRTHSRSTVLSTNSSFDHDFTTTNATSVTPPTSCSPPEIRAKVAYLAENFASFLPAGTTTVSALQGYLLCYKTEPRKAVEFFPKWIAAGCPQGLMMVR